MSMNIYEWLGQVHKLDLTIDNLLEEQQNVKNIMTKVTVGGWDNMPHGHGNPDDPIGRSVIKLIDLQEKTNEAINKFITLRCQIIEYLEKLDYLEYKVLHMRYIKYLSWSAISADLHYSVAHLHRVRNDAVEKLEKLVPEKMRENET